MTKSKQKEAIQFMFAEIGKPIWWKSPALTKAGNPVANSPDLNASEAESIFRLLAAKDLIFPAINPAGESCFLLHHAKQDEWEQLIKDTRDIGWVENNGKKTLWYIGVFLFWVLGIVVATWLSTATEVSFDAINRQLIELKEQINTK